ncbi:MAG: hypothetical protein IK131_07125 [Paludibacteraceae bacterium]|nr:hypothetical protein [Paludibacteraceae bacterium]
MKYIKKIGKVKDFYLRKGEEIIVTAHNIQIGNLSLNAAPDDDVFCENDVLTKREHFKKQFTYKDGKWNEDSPRYGDFQYFSENLYYSTEYDKDAHLQRYSIIENGKETLCEIKSEQRILRHQYIRRLSIYIFPEIGNRSLLFYTKDFQFLWKYQIEEPDVTINFRGVTVAGDSVVVVKKRRIKDSFDSLYSVEGYNILTGEKLWDIKDLSFYPSLNVGPDNMLYTIYSHLDTLFINKINSVDGTLTTHEIKSDSFDSKTRISADRTAIYGHKLYFTDNRSKSPCSIGVVDLDTLKIDEIMTLDTYEGVDSTQPPLLTEDKVYVFMRLAGELHVLQR